MTDPKAVKANHEHANKAAPAAPAPQPAAAPLTRAQIATVDDAPAGYMRTPTGDLRPVEMVSLLDLMRDATVRELVSQAMGMAAQLAAFKRETFTNIHAFAAESAARYGTSWGGKKGNITLTSFDGRFKVLLASSDSIAFDERLQVAKSLVDECINEWAESSRPEIKVIVQQAFNTDKEGEVNVGRILALQRLDIQDERWLRAMAAIRDGVTITGSKQYVRFYERVKGTDEYRAISLDIAAV